MRRFAATLKRDVLIAIRSGVEMLNPLAFFALTGVVFAIVFGSDLDTRQISGIPAVWTTALFANMLAMEGIFRRDYDDGTLAHLLIDKTATLPAICAKLGAHWLLTGLPIGVLAPIVGVGFGLPPETLAMLMATVLIGTPALTLIGAMGAALVVGLGRGGVLLTLLVLPLYVPVLLLGIGVCHQFHTGAAYTPQLVGLFAILTGTLTAVPLALGPILRVSQDR